MNAPELLYGKRAAADVPVAANNIDLSDSSALVIESAHIYYALFEMPMATARSLLPVSLHPSVPALFGITFIRADDGPLGAFTLAYLGIACRTGIKPRHLIQSAFCDVPTAADFFATRYGFPCQSATVHYAEYYDRLHGEITQDNHKILDLQTTDCMPLVGAGATIKYSPPLNVVTLNQKNTMVQFEAAYDYKRVLRGRPRVQQFDSARLGTPSLVPAHAIAGSHAEVDLHLLPLRFQVDLAVPAEAGGASKIAR